MRFLALAILLIGTMAISCSDSTKIDRQLVETYTSVLLAREESPDSTTMQRTIDSSLQAGTFTKESFESALRKMSAEPQLFKAFYDSVMVEISRRRDTN